MVQSKPGYIPREQDLVKCPFCSEGMTVSPLRQGQDNKCRHCHGVGFVDSSTECRCGRPLRLDGKGRTPEGFLTCGHKVCIEKYKEVVSQSRRNAVDTSGVFFG